MPNDDLKERVKSLFASRSADPRFTEVVKKLEEVAQGIAESGVTPGLQVRVQPGHLFKLGQQLNVVIEKPQANFREVLFRAYVPESGYPVSLDFFGEEPIRCNGPDELESEIVRLLSEANVPSRLQMLA